MRWIVVLKALYAENNTLLSDFVFLENALTEDEMSSQDLRCELLDVVPVQMDGRRNRSP